MKNRSYLREIAIKVLYQILIYNKKNIFYDIDELVIELHGSKNDTIKSWLEVILSKKDLYIKLVNSHMKDWKFDRLGTVDQAILLLSVYELLDTDTPPVVAINEAVELSKKYSDDKVVPMINAVLDKIYHIEEDNE